jgi:hypothetical protein
MKTKFLRQEGLKVRQLEDLGVDGRVILKLVRIWIGFIGLRKLTGIGFLCTE